MSADNQIARIDMIDENGNPSYRVTDNVSMSYNILGLELDLTDKEQVEIIHNIWKDARVFGNRVEANVYCDELQENNYYEYGCGHWHLNMTWEEFILLAKKIGVC